MSIEHKEDQIQVTKTFYSLGTLIRLKLYGGDSRSAIEEAQERIFEIDDKMSAFKRDSEITKINDNAGGPAREVSEDTLFVIRKAVWYSKLSSGAFDPTIRPLVNLWGIRTEHAKIPDEKEIHEALSLVNYKDIIIDEKNHTVKLNNANQSIDLGSIAKGYAADETADIFHKNGVESAIIDLGGNILALGNKPPDGTEWEIGIQDPWGARGDYIGAVKVINKSVVTSGSYEKYFSSSGKRYHHILDPRTGYPSENGLVSVTIISDFSIDGDALSTCIYIMGIEKGMKLIKSLEGLECILVTEDRRILTSGVY
ncbi:MAG: FAD:protein FMN transferase [Ruminiclostridium sp.]|nr:FAD:protein FMN transferase [Ruminiclostridium sp.]